MFYKITLELHIDPANYDTFDASKGEDVFDLESIVYEEVQDLMRTDLLSACVVEEVK